MPGQDTLIQRDLSSEHAYSFGEVTHRPNCSRWITYQKPVVSVEDEFSIRMKFMIDILI